jgi:hypothetical protein
MGSIVLTKDSHPGTGFVIDAHILRRLNHAEIRAEADRLRAVLENPGAATAADREDQRTDPGASAGGVTHALSCAAMVPG